VRRGALLTAAVVAGLLVAAPARAHHGGAAVGVAGAEGPGAAMETTSALPLPEGTGLALLKSEYVPFRQYASLDGANKTWASFNTVALGYGIRPWLSAFVFQPVNAKAAQGIGTDVGPGDTSLMLSFAFKYDEGLRLVPEKESLDELLDWHFSAWASSTIPGGPTEHVGNGGAPFAPDMQIGFGAPSVSVGASALKQLTPDLTALADGSYQRFLPHTYSFTRYQFGGESRLDAALVLRAYASGRLRLDVSGELNGLHLERDLEQGVALPASGGTVLYGTLGARALYGPLSAALSVKRAAARSLNEGRDQQGSEGLENLRAAFTLSYATKLF
jgi:hypothetical protein